MTGRPRKPTALRVLQGVPGHRPLPKDEPQPTGHASRPKWLRGGGVRVWDDYFPILDGLGLLTDADSEAFAQWCALANMFRVKGPAGMPANKMARMDALSQRFGMDPASRARLSVKPRTADDEKAGFLGVG